MHLTHKIALDATDDQISYFKKAAGTSRFVWNWGLAEWKRQYAKGEKPKAMELKKQFNAIKYDQYPWIADMHRDSHAQPFAYLAKAWNRFFSDLKTKKSANEPQFKKKGKTKDSFYIANDKFSLQDNAVILPKIGKVLMRESLRFEGKIMAASISRKANKWFIAIQVDLPDSLALKKRQANTITGIDLGISAAVTLSNGEKIYSPKPLKQQLRCLRIRSKRLSHKIKSSKNKSNYLKKDRIIQEVKPSISNNQKKASLIVAKLYARISNIRTDFTHKLTTRLCRENQVLVIEDLNVKGMLANEKLAGAISDIGFGEIGRQLEYKSLRYATNLIVADRWYPSTKLCSACGWKNEKLSLKDRIWTCSVCNFSHDRDINAALNLKRLATKTALPVANLLVTKDTLLGKFSNKVGKVTPVRYECGL